MTAKYAALAPFGRVAALLSELLPLGGATNAGTVRNRTLRVGEDFARVLPGEEPKPKAAQATLMGWTPPTGIVNLIQVCACLSNPWSWTCARATRNVRVDDVLQKIITRLRFE